MTEEEETKQAHGINVLFYHSKHKFTKESEGH
jgi:hypothetical protein